MSDVPGGRAAGTLTWAGVHNTFFWVDRASGLTAVLMMQLLPANDPAVLETLIGFEAAGWDEAIPGLTPDWSLNGAPRHICRDVNRIAMLKHNA